MPLSTFAWLRSHAVATDRLVAAALTAVAVPAIWLIGNAPPAQAPDVWAVVLTAGKTVPLAWRRQRPDLVLVVTGSAALLYDVAGYPAGLTWPALALAVYSFAVHRPRRTDLWPAALWVGEIVARAPLANSHDTAASILGLLAYSALAWGVGEWVRSREIETERFRARAEQAESEREAQAQRAVGEERTRIARELHDVVSHALGVIVMQAGGAGRVRDLNVGQARTVLANVETTARQALGEMRSLVGVLRDEDATAELGPQPTVSDLQALVDGMNASGVESALVVDGEPCRLAAGAELSAYRIVQEALTNTLKHSGATRVTVGLRWGSRGLEIEVVDNGSPRREAVSVAGTGHGLVGMRERVALYHGELEAGPSPNGGYSVVARLPAMETP